MKIKTARLLSEMVLLAQTINDDAAELDAKKNHAHFKALEFSTHLFLVDESGVDNDENLYFALTFHHCNGYFIVDALGADGGLLYSLFDHTRWLIEKHIVENGTVQYDNARQTIANEVSQFLQDAGFEDASKAVDCEFEL